MTKTKKTIMWATIACLLVVGVAGGAVGVTYSRYASTGTGTGSASIAYWDVTVGSGTVTSGVTASPSADSYLENQARYNTSAPQEVAVITNSGNVDAKVTAELSGDLNFVFTYDSSLDPDSDGYYSDYAELEADAANHFVVEICDESGNALSDDLTVSAKSGGQDGEVTIYAEVTWYTDKDGATYTGETGDYFDTFCGTYLSSITFAIDITATQASAN